MLFLFLRVYYAILSVFESPISNIFLLYLPRYNVAIEVLPRTQNGCNFVIQYTGCSKSLGHILTMNISETIKDIKAHLVNSESL